MPSSIIEYLDPAKSPMNPANIGFPFFVYGIFPLTLAKLVALISGLDTYEGFTLVGRGLSALADLFAVAVLFKVVEYFEKEYDFSPKLKFFTVFFYAISVLPIQLSHFFAVDTFLNGFLLLSFYSLLRKKAWLSAIFFGLAAASKVTAVFFLPVLVFLMFKSSRSSKDLLKLLFLFFLVSFLILKITNPYIFSTGNIFDPKPHPLFLKNLQDLKILQNPDIWYPPSVQWINKRPVTFALNNLVTYGLGIPLGILAVTGAVYLFSRRRYAIPSVLLSWVLVFFLYESSQFTKNMRYFLILYPYLAFFAAYGLIHLFRNKYTRIIILTLTVIWPMAFFSIYLRPHSRVEATRWILENIPTESRILVEHWDDALPLPLEDPNKKTYTLTELPVFDKDSDEKWERMSRLLKSGDYYVLSSNRAWGSVTTVPEKYPRTSQYYRELLGEKTEYRLVKKITSYPSLRYLGIPLDFPDQQSDESFTVYDHPVVLIYQRLN